MRLGYTNFFKEHSCRQRNVLIVKRYLKFRVFQRESVNDVCMFRLTVKMRIFSIYLLMSKKTLQLQHVYEYLVIQKHQLVNRSISVKRVRANKKQQKGLYSLSHILCSCLALFNRMRIKKLPRILALHLKRFKYVEVFKQYKKLSYRVVFPFELRLLNTVSILWEIYGIVSSSYFQSEDCTNNDRIYDLVSLVVHCGIGPNRGHYIAVVKRDGSWLVFDDETVDVREKQISN